MSIMRCDDCERLVDTDDDPDSLYIQGKECLCITCRSRMETEIDELYSRTADKKEFHE